MFAHLQGFRLAPCPKKAVFVQAFGCLAGLVRSGVYPQESVLLTLEQLRRAQERASLSLACPSLPPLPSMGAGGGAGAATPKAFL